MLLRETLATANCRTTMIAHVSDAPARHAETLSTVQLAAHLHRLRRKKVKVGSASRLPLPLPRAPACMVGVPGPRVLGSQGCAHTALPRGGGAQARGRPKQNRTCSRWGLWLSGLYLPGSGVGVCSGQPGGMAVACTRPRPGPAGHAPGSPPSGRRVELGAPRGALGLTPGFALTCHVLRARGLTPL